MDITLYEIKMDNLEVRIKGTKPDEVAGCRYIVYIKKKLFDPDIMGNSREYILFKTYPEFKKLVHGLSEVAAGGSGRAKLPILGPNPYSIDFMDGDEKNAKIRLEFTMKRLTDVIDIVMKDQVLRVHPIWVQFIRPSISTSRKPI